MSPEAGRRKPWKGRLSIQSSSVFFWETWNCCNYMGTILKHSARESDRFASQKRGEEGRARGAMRGENEPRCSIPLLESALFLPPGSGRARTLRSPCCFSYSPGRPSNSQSTGCWQWPPSNRPIPVLLASATRVLLNLKEFMIIG